jgi:hypothetical protein
VFFVSGLIAIISAIVLASNAVAAFPFAVVSWPVAMVAGYRIWRVDHPDDSATGALAQRLELYRRIAVAAIIGGGMWDARDDAGQKFNQGGGRDALLTDELAKLSAGAGFAAKRLPIDAFEMVVIVRALPEDAAAAFSGAMARVGRLLTVDRTGPGQLVAGVVGGGLMNSNPAVVEVRLASMADGYRRARLTGTAKEGLIYQRAGEKAVRRVLATLDLGDIQVPPP